MDDFDHHFSITLVQATATSRYFALQPKRTLSARAQSLLSVLRSEISAPSGIVDKFARGGLWKMLSQYFGGRSENLQYSDGLQVPDSDFCFGPGDTIICVEATVDDLERIFALLPKQDLAAPLDTGVHIRLVGSPDTSADETRSLAAKLKSGSPFERIFFYADTEREAARFQDELRMTVHVLPSSERAKTLDGMLSTGPSLEVERFGPMAVIVTALWGRVGSSAIFDAQTRYFLDKGYLVVRLFIDHHPQTGTDQEKRIETFITEDMQGVKPHLYAVCERNTSSEFLAALRDQQEFKDASPLLRTVLILGEPIFREPKTIAWIKAHSSLAVVNHTMHFVLGERLTSAPIILETHDILSDLLSSHGIPYFTPVGTDSKEMRVNEERQIWMRASACVNLSPNDHAAIAPHARHARFIRPYIPARSAGTRAWEDVVKANALGDDFNRNFDIVLWGTWHQGNIDGIHWFLEKVRPRHPALEDASILIVGRVINGLQGWVRHTRGVYCTGPVDRIEDFLRRAKVLVIPDRSGTGISIKVMEASALCLPFASTADGLRTLDISDTRIAPHTGEQGFADEVAMLLESARFKVDRIEDAKRIYEKNFSKSAYETAWDAVITNVRALDS